MPNSEEQFITLPLGPDVCSSYVGQGCDGLYYLFLSGMGPHGGRCALPLMADNLDQAVRYGETAVHALQECIDARIVFMK